MFWKRIAIWVALFWMSCTTVLILDGAFSACKPIQAAQVSAQVPAMQTGAKSSSAKPSQAKPSGATRSIVPPQTPVAKPPAKPPKPAPSKTRVTPRKPSTEQQMRRKPLRKSSRRRMFNVTPALLAQGQLEVTNPMRGFYHWYDYGSIPDSHVSQDSYSRFLWRDVEPAKGQYNFAPIEAALKKAEASHSKFAFRVMAIDTYQKEVGVPDDFMGSVPGQMCAWNHATAQEVKQVWVPEWNSQEFLARAQALSKALGDRFNGDTRLAYYDLGIYGNWGEWHNSDFPVPEATLDTKRKIIDMQVNAFPNSLKLMNAGAGNDALVYALGKSPEIGYRIDSLGSNLFEEQLQRDPVNAPMIRDRWKTAPIIVEFIGGNMDFELSAKQVKDWHVAAVANGNSVIWNTLSPTQQQSLLKTGMNAGYRFEIDALDFSIDVSKTEGLVVHSNWSNVGTTPMYEPFQVNYQLWLEGQLAWSGNSHLNLKSFMPTNAPIAVDDTFTLPQTMKPGKYVLMVTVTDQNQYRPPLKLAIEGMDDTGKFYLGEVNMS